jgi:hypothetical protein
MTWKVSLLSLCFALECAACQTHVIRPSADGEHVAQGLNARYDDTRMACVDGHAAFYCNGVMIRATDAVPTEGEPDRHAWGFSRVTGTPEGLSFSYVRKDIDSRVLYGDETRPHGLIIEPAAAFVGAPGGDPVTVLCSFSYDGMTSYRATTGDPAKGSNGCGADRGYPLESLPCRSQGIETVDSWREHFGELADFPDFPAQHRHQCSFETDQPSFALSIAARDPSITMLDIMRHMELMLGHWHPESANDLPIEAFFYTAGKNEAAGLAGARLIQRDYEQVTGKVAPIVRYDVDTNVPPFSYRESDQAVAR